MDGALESFGAREGDIEEVMVGNIKPGDTDVESLLSDWTYLGLGRVA